MASVELKQGRPALVFGDMLPLGHEIASATYNRDLTVTERGQVLCSYLRNLRVAAHTLVTSTDPDRQATVRSIDKLFETNQLGDPEIAAFQMQEGVMAWIAGADGLDLKEFCEQNLVNHADHQVALDKAAPYLREKSLDMIGRLVDMEMAPPSALQTFEMAQHATGRLVALDSFEAGGEMLYAVAKLGKRSQRIGISNFFYKPNWL